MRTLSWGNLKTVDYVTKKLQDGQAVLAEGDTVLGLLTDVSIAGRVLLDRLKSRSKKPYLILVRDYKKALILIDVAGEKLLQIEKLMNSCWPGPVTLIFRAKPEVPLYVKSLEGTIALRVPDHAGLLRLLEKFDGLFSTSANNSGHPVPHCIENVAQSIQDAVACVVLNDEHIAATSIVPSTIIDCTGECIVIVREGAVSADMLLRMLNGKMFL